MKIAAIISEYNPLHNGHLYHINKTKEITNSDAIICIMSGNYVQRGTPAIIDKWNRTKAAIKCGVDLVIELPVIYSLSSAEFFAFGAVSLLNSLGIIDSLSFGSEIGETDFIMKVAKILLEEPVEFKKQLKQYLDNGSGYPKARGYALRDYFSLYEGLANEDLIDTLNSSNNILGIEYCKSLLKLKSNIKPYTVKRQGNNYNDVHLNNIFSSATSIRKYMKSNNDIRELESHMPSESFELVNKLQQNAYPFVFEDSMLPYIKYKTFTLKDSLTKLPDVSEGLHNRIYNSLYAAQDYHNLLDDIKTKRYTYTRINRILCQYYVGFDNYDTQQLRKEPCPYCRVLGFNNIGSKILRLIKQNSNIPLYTKLPKNINQTMELDLKATETYSLLNNFVAYNSDYLISPIITD